MTELNSIQVGPGVNLNLAGTQSTPAIQANWDSGLLQMSGESYPENTYELFTAVIAWVDQFLAETSLPLRLELHLNYLNTSSIRAMIDVFDRLQMAFEAGRELSVVWLYDSRNPRSAELGEEFREDYTFSFAITAAPFVE